MSLCQPRIGREIFMLMDKYGLVTSQIRTGHIDADTICIITIIIQDLDIELKIILDNRYPFSPPQHIFINGKDYSKMITGFYYPLRDIYIEYQYQVYSCITSIINRDNWYPGRQLVDICDEVTTIIKNKKHVLNIYYCRKLATQWLTHDIPLEHYL